MSSLVGALSDGAVIAKRNLIKIKRVPDLIVFTTLSPIMFVLLFAYVFGSSISIPGGTSYKEFLLPGIFVQTAIFGSTITGAALADDMQKGIIDRFRSLPMSRSAVLFGRTGSDVLNNVITIAVMATTGLLIGWRVRDGLLNAAGAVLLLLAFAYAFSWVFACVGLLVKTPEVVNNASFIVIFPLTFVADTFVPAQNLPTVLKVFAEWNPVSAVAQGARSLFGNTSLALPPPGAWSLRHPVVYTLLWCAALLAVFVPLATALYKRAARR